MSRNLWNAFGGLGLSVVLYAIVGLISCPLPAFAHGIHVSAHVHDGAIHGKAQYSDDTPVRGATVTAFDGAGEKIGETTTNEKGEFSLEAKFRCDHRLLIETGDGHGQQYIVRATQLPRDLPPRGDAPVSAASGEDPLEGIRHDLVRLRKQLWLRDVLGGLGYILGIAGIAFYFLGVRRKQSERRGQRQQ